MPSLTRPSDGRDAFSEGVAGGPGGGPGGAPLGRNANSVAAWALDEAFRTRRLRRFLRRKRSQSWLRKRAVDEARTAHVEWVDPGRIARCTWRIAEQVGVMADLGRPARFSGVERCESIWACPVCSGGIREGRSQEVQRAADLWASQGNSVAMASFTMRHKRSDALRDTLGQLMAAYRRMVQQRAFRALKERLGVAGWIRAVEVTVTWNGWHPHVHVLWFLKGQLDADTAPDLERSLFELWSSALLREGARSISRKHGVMVTYGHAAALTGYLAKVQDGHEGDGWTIGREMTRHDVKASRAGARGRVPFELLDSGDAESRGLWLEYVDATKGRRAIEWSRGLRDLLAMGKEATDAEVLDSVEAESLLWVIPGPEYDSMAPEQRVAVLEAAEDTVAARSGQKGHEA